VRQAVDVHTSGGPVLAGDLDVPESAYGLVVFAHRSGSSRLSPRNQAVARTLADGGLATLLIDLLDEAEEREDVRTARLRFDIGLLADRVTEAVESASQAPATAGLPVGLFGASTGAAAALVAAARLAHRPSAEERSSRPSAGERSSRPSAGERGNQVRAVVSRGGRVDLAGDALPEVEAPTLLVVGGHDRTVIDLNRQAAGHLRAVHQIEIVPGAGHLFEEPGALDRVAERAAGWFRQHLAVNGAA